MSDLKEKAENAVEVDSAATLSEDDAESYDIENESDECAEELDVCLLAKKSLNVFGKVVADKSACKRKKRSENTKAVEDYCKNNLPKVHPVRPQASFLIWLDCTKLGLTHDKLIDLFVNRAHLALNDGEMFGKGGEGHMRLNIANPREMIINALEQLKEAISSIDNKK